MRRLSGRPSNRSRRPSRPRLPSSRRGRIALVVVAVLLVLGAWTAWDLRAARRDVLAARNELSAAASNLSDATDTSAAATLRRATQHAVDKTSGAAKRIRRSPILRLAGFVPGISAQRDGVVRAVETARAAAGIGDRLAAVAQQQGDGLTVANGAVDVGAVRVLADAVARAGDDLRDLPRTHRDAQWGPLGHATSDLDRLIGETARRLTNGGGVMHVAADLLGADRPQRVFIALLNNGEMRDQGMVLSYAVAETADGAFHLTRSGSVVDIELDRAVSQPALPPGTQKIFGSLAPARLWQSTNATADTALSGALMRSMYRDATGDSVDGVVALDVPALSRLLAVTGPVTVTGIPEPVSADNAVKLLLDDLYRTQDSYQKARADRLEQLAATTGAVIDKIRSSSLNGTGVIRALGDAALGGHAWVSTADPGGQRALEQAGLSGSPGRVHPERTVHISVQNGTATKLDYFVEPSVNVDVAVTEDGTAILNTTVRLANTAPVPTPASEQFGPDGVVTTTAGAYRGRVYFWGPAGGDQLDSVPESGLRLSFKVADVAAGKRSEVSFSTVVPHAVRNGVLRLRFVPQARVRAASLRVVVNGVGWNVAQPTRSLDWDRPVDLTWRLTRR